MNGAQAIMRTATIVGHPSELKDRCALRGPRKNHKFDLDRRSQSNVRIGKGSEEDLRSVWLGLDQLCAGECAVEIELVVVAFFSMLPGNVLSLMVAR